MRPKSTSTISISLETSQSTKVTQIFCPRFKHSLSSWGELGIPALNSTGILLRLPPATKNLMDTKTPCRNHHGGYKIIQEWAGRERVKEQTDTKSEQTDRHIPWDPPGIAQPKPRTQPENPWPRGEKCQGGPGGSRAQSPAGGNTFRTRRMTKSSWKSSLEQVWKSNVKHSRPREQAHTFNPLFLIQLGHCHL